MRSIAERMVAEGAMTISQAVKLSGIGRTVLYTKTKNREIASIKLGKRRLVPRAELTRILAENLVVAEEVAK